MNSGIAKPELVLIPGGSFWMGENDDDKFAGDTERPRHRVDLEAFYLGKSPVTLGEYRLFRPTHEEKLPSEWPAAMISWEEAVGYCSWLGEQVGMPYRLPTETEWEYAARAGTQTPYPWGDSLHAGHANYYYNEQGNKIGPGQRTPPDIYPPNEFGLFDMLGNVCEWVQDAWHPNYQSAPADGSAWEAAGVESLRVVRGGAWDYLPRLLRCSWRDALPQGRRRDNLGFRIAAASS
jgi:formylglycine-generating enzyme required for sulfatase activity